jgi:hypothetical protein
LPGPVESVKSGEGAVESIKSCRGSVESVRGSMELVTSCRGSVKLPDGGSVTGDNVLFDPPLGVRSGYKERK